MIFVNTKRILLIVTTLALIPIVWFDSTSESRNKPTLRTNTLLPLALGRQKVATLDSKTLIFPDDHGIHRGSGVEIWQLAGILRTQDNHQLGIAMIITRIDLDTDLNRWRSRWAANQIFHLDYAITPAGDGKIHRTRKTARSALGLAGYDQQRRSIRVYRREIVFDTQNRELPRINLNIPDRTYPANLQFKALKPITIPPLRTPFRYYALARMKVLGGLKISGLTQAVTGSAIFDHTWGNLPLTNGQLVRNRILLQLSNGMEFNLFESRRRDGSGKVINGGFMVLPNSELVVFDQTKLKIDPSVYWTSLTSETRYPVQWQVRIPDRGINLNVQAWRKNQETDDIPKGWRGMVSVSGQVRENPVTGFGYVQLTGYPTN